MDTVSNTVTIRHSEEIGKLATALAGAQGEFPEIKKERVGKVAGKSKASGKYYEYEYKYADLADILHVTHPVTAKHGLALIHIPMMQAGTINLYSRLIHGESGQWIECEYPVCKLDTHQSMGGSMSYAKRQATTALLCVAADADLDAQEGTTAAEADGKGEAKPERRRTQPKPEVVQGASSQKPLPPKLPDNGPLNEDDSMARLEAMLEDIRAAQKETLIGILEGQAPTVARLTQAHHNIHADAAMVRARELETEGEELPPVEPTTSAKKGE